MYYFASTFGSTISSIGLATAQNLKGPWEDKGIVVKTHPEKVNHNAIDANVVWDKNGKLWLCYGSFFGGIYLTELDPESGKLTSSPNQYGECIAKRSKCVDTAIEGAFIYYHSKFDYYYLFTSYDSLFDTYNIRVAQSKK